MKLGVIADLHLDSPFVWAGPAAGAKWRRALRDSLDAAVDLALELGLDAFLLAGDIYEHDKVAPDTAAFLSQTLSRLHPMPVLIAPGNHDYLCPSSVWVQASWSPNVHVFDHQDWSAFELAEGLSVWGISHSVAAGTGAMLDQLTIDRGGVNLGLFHGALRNGRPDGATAPELHLPFDRDDIVRSGLTHAFCGHYHVARLEQHLTYPGNPNPLTFGESSGRGFVVATIGPDGSVDSTVHDIARFQLHDVSADLTGAATSDDARRRCYAALSGLKGGVRLSLTGDLSADVNLNAVGFDDIHPALDALSVKTDALRPGYDLDALQLEPTVRGQFVREVLGAELLDDADRNAVLVTGLRALDGRSDLEVPW